MTSALDVGRAACARASADPHELRSWFLTDLPYVPVAAAMWVLLPAGHPLGFAVAAAAVGVFLLAGTVWLPLRVGFANCLQPAFVLVLFVVPLNMVPAVVGVVTLFGYLSRGRPLRSLARSLSENWYCVAPTLIVALAAPHRAIWSDWPIYAAAFGAQFLFEGIISAGRRALDFGSAAPDRGTVLLPLAVDILLTPVGLTVAVTVPKAPVAAFALVLGVLGVVALLSHERKDRLENERRALHDPLTGLANRVLFDELADAAARRCVRTDTTAAVVVLDVNGFKAINDTYGHACGDRVLRAVAERLLVGVREADTVARLGGDEFAVLLVDPATIDDAHAVAGSLRRAFDAPVDLGDLGAPMLSASIGIAEFSGDVVPEQALAAADRAMYAEKHACG